MNELLDTQVLGAGGHPASPSFMDGREGLPLRRRENANQIDDRIRTPDGRAWTASSSRMSASTCWIRANLEGSAVWGG